MDSVNRIGQYYHTLRYLKVSQLWFRCVRGLRGLIRTSHVPAPYHFPTAKWQYSTTRPYHSEVLVDTVWHPTELNRLQLYHLHYFDEIAHLSPERAMRRMQSWVQYNPPQEGVGWESYPLSQRIVNWIKYFLAHPQECPPVLASLSKQAAVLSQQFEWDLLGNHLLANAKALWWAGLFFTGDMAWAWQEKGARVFLAQLALQILSDGGHEERSPMYHALILEDILDIIALHKLYEKHPPAALISTAEKMLAWLAVMQHPDGDFPLFNDTALNQVPKLQHLSEYATRLGITNLKHSPLTRLLHPSGYAKLVKGPFIVFVDVGPVGPPHQPGHAHADTLSFELSVGTERILVNSGISTYEPGPLRHFQRSSAAHNTVVINKQNSSEVWGSFRVARRASPQILWWRKDTPLQLIATHNGYQRLPGAPTVVREWKLFGSHFELRDVIKGQGVHTIEWYFYVHPDVRVEQKGNIVFLYSRWYQTTFELDAQVQLTVKASQYYPGFGVSVPNQVIYGRYQGIIPKIFKHTLECAPCIYSS